MRLRILGLAGLGLALAMTGAPLPRAAHSAPARPAEAWPALQAYADPYVATGKVPGMVIAIGEGDAPTSFVSAGKISADPNAEAADADSLWRVYSMTKPLTAMAVMILVEEGKIRLDQPLSDFIPAFKTMCVLDVPDGDSLACHPAKSQITIREMLTHTAGLGYNIITKGALLDAYNAKGITPGQINRGLEASAKAQRPTSLEAFANKVATLPLVYEPGTKWSYSIALDVLGRVVEVAGGMPFDSFLQKRIFDPLKMRSSFFTVPASEIHRLSTNYYFAGDTRIVLDPAATSVYLDPPSFPYGGAGLVMSARDYDTFLHMLQDGGTLDGVRILKPATAKLAMSNLLPPGADTSLLNGKLPAGAKLGFGAGGSVYLAGVPGGPPTGVYGWGGAASTIAWVDPVRKIRGNVMVNYIPTEHWPIRADLNKALYGDLAK